MKIVVSERLLIKDDVYRSVHIYPNGVARWVITYRGRLISISGRKENDRFICDEKFTVILQNYKPQRESRKKRVIVNIAPSQYGDCLYRGQKRRILYTNLAKTKGRLSFEGRSIKVAIENGIAIDLS